MPSGDQSSGAGSGNLKVAEINDSVIPELVKDLEQIKELLSQTRPDHNNRNSGNNGSSHSSQDDNQSVDDLVEKLRKDLLYIRKSFENLKDFEEKASDLLKYAIDLIDALKERRSPDNLGTVDPNVSSRAKLVAMNKIMIELKFRIPLPQKLSSTESDAWGGTEFDDLEVLEKLPVLHVDIDFRKSSAFQDFRLVYESLELRTKMCLLCFAVIPEDEIVKKTFMTYWWVGEGFVSPQVGTSNELSVEKVAHIIFQELAEKDCIEPVSEKHRFLADGYKMNPLFRSAVIVLAKEAGFFDFDKNGNPSDKWKSSYRACLVDVRKQSTVDDGSNYQESFQSKSESKSGTGSDAEGTGPQLEAEKLRTIFNVNEPYPDFFELERFSKLKNVRVLYLGRWQTSAKHHIEVDSVEFLKGLKSMKLLRLFSLQGILGIIELPDSLCKLVNLRILDLRACQNLEVLPEGIGSLKNLTHLDISECYLLDYMPKGIGTLSQLQVLKGFVISGNLKSCTLKDLSELGNLGKLSIHTNRNDFPTDTDMTFVNKFKKLQKLIITWGAGAFQTKEDSRTKQDEGAASATNIKRMGRNLQKIKNAAESAGPIRQETLEKLDLNCFPRMEAPSWLLPGNFPKLEKLYIREGNLQNLSPGEEKVKWKVNTLRLKSLSNLKMDWKELRASFPELRYLEKYKCPKLTFFPCNENEIQLKDRTERRNESSCEA